MMTGLSLILFGVICFIVSHEVPIMPMWMAITLITLAMGTVILSYFADNQGSRSR